MLYLLASLVLGSVTSVTDGDTVKVKLDSEQKPVTVRLACIDSPERKQEGGLKSTLALYRLIPPGQLIQIESSTRDRYGRIVGLIESDGKLINLGLIETGDAVIYPQYFKPCRALKREFDAAQQKAQDNSLGFWALPKELQILPWIWRKNN